MMVYMKKYILGAALLVSVSVLPVVAQAQTTGLTSSQINAIIQLLQSFGADQSVINNVQVSLNGGTPTTVVGQSSTVSGSSTTGGASLYCSPVFTNNSASVKKFQAQNGISQTGTVGPITRAKLNSLYSCSSQSTVQTPQPTPQSVPPTATTSSENQTATVPSQDGCTATSASSQLSGTIQSISNDQTQIILTATRTYTVLVNSSTVFVSASGNPLSIANFGRDDQVTVEGSVGNGGMGAYCPFTAQQITLNVSGIHTLKISGKVESVIDHPQTLMILEDNGISYSFIFTASTVVKAATGSAISIDDLRGGDSVSITGQGRTGDHIFSPSEVDVIAGLTQIPIPVAPVGTQPVNVSGTILAISGGNITLSATDGKIYSVQVTPPTDLYATTYTGGAATLTDLHTGDSISITGHASAAYLAGHALIADTIKKN